MKDITLICVDCVNLDRAVDSIQLYANDFKFSSIKILTNTNPNNYNNICIIPKLNNIDEYSKFILNDLTNYVDTEFCLLVQWDGIMLNPTAWKDTFLNYDYIGAPWAYQTNNVGNGGFSLRSKKLLELLHNMKIVLPGAEDNIICRTGVKNELISAGITFADEEIAFKFSIEGNPKFGNIYTNQLGFHSFTCTNITDKLWPNTKYLNYIKKWNIHYNISRYVTKLTKLA
jgi:hypothetical protein